MRAVVGSEASRHREGCGDSARWRHGAPIAQEKFSRVPYVVLAKISFGVLSLEEVASAKSDGFPTKVAEGPLTANRFILADSYRSELRRQLR